MLEDTSFTIWLWIILSYILINLRGYRKIKNNEQKKRGEK